ncbi:MAG: alpha/beta fold hydrolase [Xanthobacteraceae bacterium]
MPIVTVNGVNINYEILGDRGPWIALSPGGRREMGNVRPLAQKMAAAGYRVLINDRRNCGKSDISFDASQSEYEVWVDDLHALLAHFGALPAVIGGGSSGGRLAMLFALRYPRDTRTLLLWRVTGGPFAAKRLAEQYYDQYIRLAEQGGMDAIAKSEHFAERIAQNPANREKLLALSKDEFVAVMKSWREYFNKSADLPVIGATEHDLNSIHVPTIIIPGNDRTHSHVTGAAAHRMIQGSELYDLWPGDLDIDLFPAEDWAAKEAEQAAVFTRFLSRVKVAA